MDGDGWTVKEEEVQIYKAIAVALQKQITHLESANEKLVKALERIAKQDLCDKAVDVVWLTSWRNYAKRLAQEAMKEYRDVK